MLFFRRINSLFIIIPVILSVSIAAFLIYELINSHRHQISSAKLRNSGVARIMASRFAGALREIDFVMLDIHDHISPDQLAFTNGANGPESIKLNQLLSRKITKHPWLSGLGVLNRTGIFIGGVNRNEPMGIGSDFSFRKYFSHLVDNKNKDSYFSPVFIESSSKKFWLACSRTLRLKQGQFDGVIMAGLTVRYIEESLLGEVNFTIDGSVALLDIEKGLIFREPGIKGLTGEKSKDKNLDAFISSGKKSLTFIALSPFEQKRKVISFHRAGEFPYILVVASNIETDLAAWYKDRLIYFCSWLFSTIVLFLLAYNFHHLYIANRSLKEKNNEIAHMLNHDTLTGLSSLRLANEKLELVLSLAERSEKKVAVLFLDLDGFKAINDTYGHDAGDEVLIQVAHRINAIIRQGDTACRIGGDEFLIILSEMNIKSEIKAAAERLVNEISQEIKINNCQVRVGVSIGVSIYPDDADNAADLRKKADQLMYSVKKAGKNNVAMAL